MNDCWRTQDLTAYAMLGRAYGAGTSLRHRGPLRGLGQSRFGEVSQQ
jgi:hypothetical protein